MKHIFLVLALTGCTTLNVADPSGLLGGSTSPDRKIGSSIIPQQIGDFWGNNTAVSPFAIKDTGGVTRDTFETLHGVIVAGNGGSDTYGALGPLTSNETTLSALWLLPHGTARTSGNPAVWSDGSNLLLNATGSLGAFNFYNNATGNNVSKFANVSGAQYGLWLGTGVAFSSSNYSLISDASSFSAVNFPSGGYFGIISANANYVTQFAGGTQGGVALGANPATVGHIRTPSGWIWQSRNSANSANNIVLYDDGANSLNMGSGYSNMTMQPSSQFFITAGSSIAIESGNDQYLDETTLHLRNASHTEYMTLTPAAASLIQFNATNATSGAIGWTGPATAAGNPTTITGEAAGGAAADGGPVTIAGGAHAGSANVDGSVKITTPLNGGFLSTTVAANTTLTAAQSDANFVLLTSVALGPFTLTFTRRAADTSCVWIKNAGANPVQISYITGATVTINNATSALVCSDGTNLQKLMTGTRLDPLDLKRWSPVPENDNARPSVAEKEAA